MFTNGTASHTEGIWYLVVNANSAYNILLGRPALNRLRAVASMRHMKMKLPDLSGMVIMIKSDQEEARKCYENSLKTKRGVLMVFERSPVSDTSMKIEPLEEATPKEDAPLEKSHRGASPMKEALEGAKPEAPDRATPIRESNRSKSRAESTRDRRPQPVDNVVERQIGGKVFKLGRLLSQEEQDEVAAVISRHLDAFAWTAANMSSIDPDFLCDHLTMDAKVRPVRQRRRKFNEERCLVMREETQKLLSAGPVSYTHLTLPTNREV